MRDRYFYSSVLVEFCALVAVLTLAGCASGPESDYGETMSYMPESDTYNRAPGAAYGADGMVVRKPMPTRPQWKPMEFYYKHCTQVDSRAYYSKTSYDCMGPF